MDGKLDSTARKIATNQNVDLYADWNGTELYVATQSAQSQSKDVFIFVSDSLRNLINAPWAKTGRVVQWIAFLGNESTNNWSGWFDANGVVRNTSGQVLEGTINLNSELGYTPSKVYLAVGLYQTQDGGSLQSQCPAGNGNGDIEANEFIQFDFLTTSFKEEKLLLNFDLKQNYPNPFNSKTNIRFSLPRNSFITLKVYDVLGREVRTLVSGIKSSGIHNVEFDASELNSGIYIYTLRSGEKSISRKMILIK